MAIHNMFSSYQRSNNCPAIMLSFLFLSCISLSTDETSDETYIILLFKMWLCTLEQPYLVSKKLIIIFSKENIQTFYGILQSMVTHGCKQF